MKKILLISSSFPYYPGEQFLETEVNYYNNVSLTVLPLNSHEKYRTLPKHIKIDNYIINKKSNIFYKVYYILKSMLNPIFYKEFFIEVGINIKRVKPFLSSVYAYQRYCDLFNNYFKNEQEVENTVVYTYWHNEATYALQSLKQKYNYKLVSRIHGYDIYKERRLDSYMPLKHLFTSKIDKIFTITQSANKYLSQTYGFKDEILELSRLGVDDKSINSKTTQYGSFCIVSCSFLVDVKRIDKIIDALAKLSKEVPNIKFKWNHIGNGTLESVLKNYAMQKLSKLNNVEYHFLGNIENKDVYKFYKNNAVNVFVNVSESEGVPVSIMEAMSCHIPIIAPNIGGISDMIIDNKSGKLLSEKCEVDELVSALSDIEFFKNKIVREKTYEVYLERYNSKKNYSDFVHDLSNLN